jgi:hypothetical protein
VIDLKVGNKEWTRAVEPTMVTTLLEPTNNNRHNSHQTTSLVNHKTRTTQWQPPGLAEAAAPAHASSGVQVPADVECDGSHQCKQKQASARGLHRTEAVKVLCCIVCVLYVCVVLSVVR